MSMHLEKAAIVFSGAVLRPARCADIKVSDTIYALSEAGISLSLTRGMFAKPLRANMNVIARIGMATMTATTLKTIRFAEIGFFSFMVFPLYVFCKIYYTPFSPCLQHKNQTKKRPERDAF